MMRMAAVLPFAIGAMLAVAFLGVLFPYNYTDSLPVGFYLRLPAWNIAEGDIVQADSPMVRGYLGTHSDGNLAKRVASVSPDGLYELQGDTPLSYDSTFYGLVGPEYIKAELVPVLVKEENTRFPGIDKSQISIGDAE